MPFLCIDMEYGKWSIDAHCNIKRILFLSAMPEINFHIPQLSQSFSMNGEVVKPPSVAVYLKGAQGFCWSFKQMWLQTVTHIHYDIPKTMTITVQYSIIIILINRSKMPHSTTQPIGRYKINNFTISIKDFRIVTMETHEREKNEQNMKTIEYGKK